MAFSKTIEVRTEVQPWGATWKMMLEEWTLPSGRTQYSVYHFGGQSYPVGSFRSLKAARKVLDSFSGYVIDSIALAAWTAATEAN